MNLKNQVGIDHCNETRQKSCTYQQWLINLIAIANIIAGITEMLVKSTRSYPYFGGSVTHSNLSCMPNKVGIKSCRFYQHFYCSSFDVS